MAVFAYLALVGSGAATAATVVNGNFETGDLSGWRVYGAVPEVGNWFAYQGTEPPIKNRESAGPVQAPPQGSYAAISDELNPDTLILSQEIALEPRLEHRLSLTVYYHSYRPIAVPTPDTLSVDYEVREGQPNQQYRIDVMRPGAPIESIDPADILRTIFRTQPGGPEELPPTRLTADLSQFAGQTVRLRIANAVTEEIFNAGVDAVSISSAPPGQLKPPGSKSRDSLGFGKVKVNRSNGTAILPVRVPGPGQLTAKDAPASGAKAGASKVKRVRHLIKPASAKAAKAGTVTIRLQPTASALAILGRKHKLRVRVAVTYKPAGDSPETAIVPVVLRLNAGAHQRR